MQIVLDVANEFKPVVEDLALLLRVLTAQVEQIRGARTTDYAAVERALAQRLAAVEVQAHGVLLRAADLDAPRILVNERPHVRVGRHAATYYTAAGPVVERSIDRPADDRHARAVDPVSLRTGVVGDGWLPHAARAMAFLVQQGTARSDSLRGTRYFTSIEPVPPPGAEPRSEDDVEHERRGGASAP